MRLHMIFFILEEVAIFQETLFGRLYWSKAISMEYNTYKLIDLWMNILVAITSFCTNSWVAYLMISFCNPEEITKSKNLFRILASLARMKGSSSTLDKLT